MNALEITLVVTGLLDIAAATFSLIFTGRAHAAGRLRFGKYLLMFSMAIFIALMSNWLTRGLYHASTWISIVWHLVYLTLMLGSAWALSEGVAGMMGAAKKLHDLSDRVNRILDIYDSK